MNVGKLTSGSSSFYKLSLYTWKFSVHILLKPVLRPLSIILLACEVNVTVGLVWTFLALPFFVTGNENWLFQSCDHCWLFQICWHIECSTFTASSFRIWNSSARILSPPVGMFIVVLLQVRLTSHSKMSGSRWVITPPWLSGSLRLLFCVVLLCILSIFP